MAEPMTTHALTDEEMALYVREHRCYNADRNVTLADWDRGVAATEAAAVARHVRETGCEGYRVVLLDGARSWHADAPVPGVATLTIDFGGDRSALAKVVTRINALAPPVAASEEAAIVSGLLEDSERDRRLVAEWDATLPEDIAPATEEVERG